MSDELLKGLVELSSSRPLALNKTDLIASGGAGAVYAHPLDPNSCIKLYLDKKQAQAHDAKVRAMLATPPDNVRTKGGVLQIAWPSEIVIQSGRFVGFVMPKLPSGTWRFDALDTPLARRDKRVSESLKFRLVALVNLAKVLESLHAKDHFVVDLQPKNIYAYAQEAGAPPANSGFISLIDCDGFSIAGRSGSGQRYHAELVMEDYFSPHALDPQTLMPDADRLRGFERQQDLWAFALNAFRMLNHGLKPWDAKPKPHVRNPPDGKFRRIFELDRNYAYGRRPNPDFEALGTSRHASFSPELLDLFERTFRSSPVQPTLDEWVSVLGRLLSNQNACSKSSDHWKLGATCGECGKPPPPSPLALAVNQFGNFSTATAPFQPTISLTGTGLNSVNEIRFTSTDPNGVTGTATFNAANNFGGTRFGVGANGNSATISPALIATNSPAGTYRWSVIFVAGRQSVTRNFTVTYTPVFNPPPSPPWWEKLRELFNDYWWTAPVATVALLAIQYIPQLTDGADVTPTPTESATTSGSIVLDSSQPLVLNPYHFNDSRFDAYWTTDEGLTELVERAKAINAEMEQPLLQCFYKGADGGQSVLYWNGRVPASANPQELAQIQPDHPYQTIHPAVARCPDAFESQHPYYDAEKAKELGIAKRKTQEGQVTSAIITTGTGGYPQATDTALANAMVKTEDNEVLVNSEEIAIAMDRRTVLAEQLLKMRKGETRRLFIPSTVAEKEFATFAKGGKALTIELKLLDFRPTSELPPRPTPEPSPSPPPSPSPTPTGRPVPPQSTTKPQPTLFGANFDGDWTGTYRCQQGETAVSIELYRTSPYLIEGNFTFSATARNPGVPFGKFRLSGRTSPGSRSVILDPAGWIERPSGYQALRVRLALSPDGNSISGSFPANAGCTSLRARRN